MPLPDARGAGAARRGSGAVWPVVEAAVGAGLSLASALLVARMVGPAEVGIGAAAVAVQVLLAVAVTALFADPLAQSDSTDARDLAGAVWAAAAAGGLAALAMAASGPALALALEDARLGPMCVALALPLPLVGAAGAVQGLATRARDYRLIAARAALGQGVGTLVGVAAAGGGLGAWALVAQQGVGSAVGAAVLLLAGGWRPAGPGRWRGVAGLLRLGVPMAGSVLVQHAKYRLFALLVGGMLGPAALGQLHLAFRLVETGRDVASTALWRLLHPAFAECGADAGALRARLEAALAGYAPVLLAACAAAMLAGGPGIRWLLGPGWEAAASAVPPLVLLAGWTFLTFAAGTAAIARGGAGLFLAVNLAGLGLTLAAAALWQPASPAAAAWLWTGVQAALSPWLVARLAQRLALPAGVLFRAGMPGLAAAGLAWAAGFAGPALLGLEGGPGAEAVSRLGCAALVWVPVFAVCFRGGARAGLLAIGAGHGGR